MSHGPLSVAMLSLSNMSKQASQQTRWFYILHLASHTVRSLSTARLMPKRQPCSRTCFILCRQLVSFASACRKSTLCSHVADIISQTTHFRSCCAAHRDFIDTDPTATLVTHTQDDSADCWKMLARWFKCVAAILKRNTGRWQTSLGRWLIDI